MEGMREGETYRQAGRQIGRHRLAERRADKEEG